MVVKGSRLLRGCVSKGPFGVSRLRRRRGEEFRGKALFPICRKDTGGGLKVQRLVRMVTDGFCSSAPRNRSRLYKRIFGVRCSRGEQHFICIHVCDKALRLESIVEVSRGRGVGVARVYIPAGNRLCSSSATYSNSVMVLPGSILRLGDVLKGRVLLPREGFVRGPLPVLRAAVTMGGSRRQRVLLKTLARVSSNSPLLGCCISAAARRVVLSFLKGIRVRIVYTVLRRGCRIRTRVGRPAIVCVREPLEGTRCAVRVRIPPGPF